MVSRIAGKGQDPYGLGKWKYITYMGPQQKIVLITAYRVCNSSMASVGDSTSAAQQFRSLQQSRVKEGGTMPTHQHKQMTLDLQHRYQIYNRTTFPLYYAWIIMRTLYPMPALIIQ
jgi:hypothetical protein